MRGFNPFSSPDFVNELKGIINSTGEYFSHLTALYLLGQIFEPPKVLTIVSPRRRRNRVIDGIPLVFIFHPSSRLKPVQMISFENESVCVSTLEKTIIDLLADLEYAPRLETLAGFFAKIPFNVQALLGIAKTTSDTVLKRTAFLLAWAGRTSFEKIPFSSFSRTPVKLDTRVTEKNLFWDNRFFIKLPTSLLSKPVLAYDEMESSSIQSPWIELRSHNTLLQKMKEKGYIPILDDPGPKAKNWLNQFFATWFEKLTTKDLETFLGSYLSSPGKTKPYQKFPTLFKGWVKENPNILKAHEAAIHRWVEHHLFSPKPDFLEAALFFGYLIGMHEKVLESLGKNGYTLFGSGRCEQIKFLCEEYLKMRGELPSTLYVLAARTFAKEGDFSKAIDVLDKGKTVFELRENTEVDCGELAYAMGNILRIMNRYHESLSELYLAREYFMAAEDRRGVCLTDSALGNLFFTRGIIRESRNFYLSGLTGMRQLKLKSAEASVLGNLGLIEYDSGYLKKALLYLNRSISLHKMLKNSWNEAVLNLSRAKVLLSMGHFTQAFRAFKDCHKQKSDQRHHVGVYECASFLGWVCDLLGKSTSAKAWWDQIPTATALDPEPRAAFVVNSLKAMTTLFKGHQEQALSMYQQIYERTKTGEAPGIAGGSCLYGIGFCQTLLKIPEAPETLAKAKGALSGNPLRLQLRLLQLFSALHHPEDFPNVDIDEQMECLCESQYFDPFWGFYAGKVLHHSGPAANRFLSHHLNRTPPSMLQGMVHSIPGFRDVIKKIEIQKQRAAEFFTLITNGTTRPIHFEDYQVWRKENRKNWFIFDGPGGIISFNSNLCYIKPGSLSHGLLTNLMSAFPHPVDCEALYRSVWATTFDPECDLGAMKSALQRLQKLLKSVNPTIRLRKKTSKSAFGEITINLNCSWETVTQ